MANFTDLPYELRADIFSIYFATIFNDTPRSQLLQEPLFGINRQLAREAVKVAHPRSLRDFYFGADLYRPLKVLQ